jgi:hypothetical protein
MFFSPAFAKLMLCFRSIGAKNVICHLKITIDTLPGACSFLVTLTIKSLKPFLLLQLYL